MDGRVAQMAQRERPWQRGLSIEESIDEEQNYIERFTEK
jgi:hypothetical protein